MMVELDPQLRDYIERGWLIFPCPWDGGKRPLIAGGFHSASRSPELVAEWWRRWPRALCAVRTGKLPMGSGIAVVDIDKKYGGFETLQRLLGSAELPPGPR